MRPAHVAMLCVPLALAVAGVRPAAAGDLAARASTARNRWYTSRQVHRGAAVYGHHCARCHGDRAQGGPGWPTPGAKGAVAAPPLNGTGHAWLWPLGHLRHVIAHGLPMDHGRMPAWKGKLSDSQINATIAWFQAWWPDSVYRRWRLVQRRARRMHHRSAGAGRPGPVAHNARPPRAGR